MDEYSAYQLLCVIHQSHSSLLKSSVNVTAQLTDTQAYLEDI